MQIYPAIDIHQGQCVRLYQGDYQQATVYQGTPFEVAEQFTKAGATWLHVIDLTGAKDPIYSQRQIIGELAEYLRVPIQTGGGIRTEGDIAYLLDKGIARIIIGSLAVKQMALVQGWLKRFGPDKLVLAFDCQIDAEGKAYIMTNGWQQKSKVTLNEMLETYSDWGLKHVLCTDIARDGTLQGPNLLLYQQLRQQFPALCFQASGGINQVSDLKNLCEIKMAGAIIGKAIYENKMTINQALESIIC